MAGPSSGASQYTAEEERLFGEENHLLSGLNFDRYDDIKVSVRPKGQGPPAKERFQEMGLHPQILENIRLARYAKPTPVQKYTIPIIAENYDCIGHGQTGSGKTAAFLVPVISRMLHQNVPSGTRAGKRGQPYVLVLAPTRELAQQIHQEALRFCYHTPYVAAVVYGGALRGLQASTLRAGCDIVVATPGRLKDFVGSKTISLRSIKTLIIDEADRMLDMGFIQDIRTIVSEFDMPQEDQRQTLMFSATMPPEVKNLAQDYIKRDFLFVRVGRVGAAEQNIEQRILLVQNHEKKRKLIEVIQQHPPGRTLIFVDTKRMADTLDLYLSQDMQWPSTSIHGDRTQAEREDALRGFKSGQTPILVATDVASRGLDIKDVIHVINFDCPKDIDSYVHRIGRTARAGNTGVATTFYNDSSSMIGPKLAEILSEANVEVPHFLKFRSRGYM